MAHDGLPLSARREDGVLILRLNRPEARNALTPDMLEELGRQLAQAEQDAEVRCILLTASGKAFCAGGDVKGMAARDGAADDAEVRLARQRNWHRETSGRLFGGAKPTIAAINGAAAGAGLGLALACDLRVMANSAFLVTAFANVAVSGDFGATYFLTHLVGPARARELFFLSERIAVEDAVRLGLANWSCADELLEERALYIARRLAAGPPVAFRRMKENLVRALNCSLEECLDMEAANHVQSTLSDEHRLAVAAFGDRSAAGGKQP